MGRHPVLDSPALQTVLTHRLWDYALRRQHAVQAGHETAELAGVLVQHYGYGLVEAVRALLGADGEQYSLDGFADKELLAIVFSCNGCPTVRAAEDGLVALQEAYAGRVQLLAINSNNPFLSPSDTYGEMVKRAEAKGFNFPYVKDADGSVAKAFGAARTPHVFLLDAERKLRYRGRIADSRDPAKVTRHDLHVALDDLLAGRAVEMPETEPSGCAIVW